MKEVFGRLCMLGWKIAAFAIVAFILWFALRAHSHMWRLVAARYRGKPASTAIARRLEVTVIAARDLRMPGSFRKYRQYPGLLLHIHDRGIGLSLVPPFNLLCPPIFLPFDEMHLERTDWALWREPYALRMQRLPETDVIIGRDAVSWIRDHIQRAPFGFGV